MKEHYATFVSESGPLKPPEGEGWRIVSTAGGQATGQYEGACWFGVLWITWERDIPPAQTSRE